MGGGGGVRTEIRYVSERETGGIILPGNVDEKTGDIVKETLELKHLEGRDALVESLPDFESCHKLINIVVRDNNVEMVEISFLFGWLIWNRFFINIVFSLEI